MATNAEGGERPTYRQAIARGRGALTDDELASAVAFGEAKVAAPNYLKRQQVFRECRAAGRLSSDPVAFYANFAKRVGECASEKGAQMAERFIGALVAANSPAQKRSIRYRARNYAETTADADAFCERVAAGAGEKWSYVRP